MVPLNLIKTVIKHSKISDCKLKRFWGHKYVNTFKLTKKRGYFREHYAWLFPKI